MFPQLLSFFINPLKQLLNLLTLFGLLSVEEGLLPEQTNQARHKIHYSLLMGSQ